MNSKYLIALATVITSLCTGISDCYCGENSNSSLSSNFSRYRSPSAQRNIPLTSSIRRSSIIDNATEENQNIATNESIVHNNPRNKWTNRNNNNLPTNTVDTNNIQQNLKELSEKIDNVTTQCNRILSVVSKIKKETIKVKGNIKKNNTTDNSKQNEKINTQISVQQPSNPPIKPKFSKRASIAQTNNYTSNSTTSQSSNPIQLSDHYKPQVLTTSVYSTQASSPYNTEPRPQYKAPYINQQPPQYQPSQNYNLRTSTYGSQYIPPSTTVLGY